MTKDIVGRRFRHTKRGTEYEVIGVGKMQAENWIEQLWHHEPRSDAPPRSMWSRVDMCEVVTYRSLADGSLWTRPRKEFEDGRFEALESLSPPEGVGLTRYELVGTGGDLTAHGWPNPEGEWVLYEDAAAALAAEKARGDGLGETLASCGQWADETFGPATPLRRIERAEEEIEEAKTAPSEKLLEEIADAVICLAAAAHSAGGDLQSAINAKMAINRKRQWSLRGDGTGYHVRAALSVPARGAQAMSIDKARPDFIAAQELLSNRWPMDVLEALDTCIRGIARAEFIQISHAPADMRKPEDGGLGEPDDWGADGAKWAAAFQETAIRLGYSDMDEGWLIGWFANAIERGRVAHPDTKRALATIAERDRRIADLEAATKAAIRAAELALFVIRKQGVMPNASWERGFDADLATARALLSGQQDTSDTHG